MKRIVAAVFAGLALILGTAEAKTYKIEAGQEAEAAIAAAFTQARAGDTIRFRRGTFDISRPLSLATDGVTIRGDGADRTILSFADQVSGEASVSISGDRTTVRGLTVQDARGDAIVATEAHGSTFQDLRIAWSGPVRASNGQRGLAAVASRDVLIDRVDVRGASDAGIFIGQAQNTIVRRSRAELNVIGILVENSVDVDVVENAATRNTVGVVIANVPGLAQQDGHDIRVVGNEIVLNDTVNFAGQSTLASTIPPGVGVLVMAVRNALVMENTIGEHATANVIITAYRSSVSDPNYNPLPRDVVVRANTFGRTGFAPAADLAILPTSGFELPDILWDGAATYVAAGVPRSEPVRIGIVDNEATRSTPVSFLSLGLPFATSPMSEIQPNSTMPSPLLLPEPAPVKLSRR